MDILYTGKVEGFCIISSDSDFTRLALRLRESGAKVIGMGQKKTPSPFIAACDKFIYIEILSEPTEAASKEDDKKEEARPANIIKTLDRKTIQLITSSVSDLADESGWAYLGDVGNLILKKEPDFDPRNYGFKKLAQFIKSTDQFEIDERQSEKGNIKHVYIKSKPVKKNTQNKQQPKRK
jgi:Fe-S-cluster formation regulator IscX/YfhJ